MKSNLLFTPKPPTHQTYRALGVLGWGLVVALSLDGRGNAGPAYTLDWFAPEGIGTTSHGGKYSLTTSSVAEAGRLSGGGYAVESGAFHVSAEFIPLVSLGLTNRVATLYWLRSFADFVLEQTPALSRLPASWSPVDTTYSTNDTHVSVSVPISEQRLFFRLRRP